MNMVYVIYNTTMTEGDSYIALLLFIKINYRNDDNMTLLNLVKANTKCKYTSLPLFLLIVTFLLLMNTTSKTASIKEIIPNITAITIAVTLHELRRLFFIPQIRLSSHVSFIITLVWFNIYLVWFIIDLVKKNQKNMIYKK